MDMGQLLILPGPDLDHKTKQLRSKLAQDLEKTRVRDSSSPLAEKIPQL
jgi:hypothetical protein